VLSAWAGLGYYARARNLHACAQAVAALGGFPADLAGLQALPGIGAYTAAAIGAIAFGFSVVPVDGNVERVVSRLFAIEVPLPAAKAAIREAAARLGADPAARARPSDFAQAMFDLGAGVCTPAAPGCAVCPWVGACAARQMGIQASLPCKAPKKQRPVRFGVHFWLTDGQGRVLLRTRPHKGLLGGMTELPGTTWRDLPWTVAEALTAAPMQLAPLGLDWHGAGQVRHGFTHFELIIDVLGAQVPVIEADGFVHPLDALKEAALPSVMWKCVRMAGSGRV
jgi:A/G-specific adenine glycosylase